MNVDNNFSKFLKLSRKKIGRILHSIRPGSIQGRFSGEKVFLTTIPKSGTNLILELLFNLPMYRIYTGRGFRPWMFQSQNDLFKKISKVKKGQICHGHVSYLNGLNEIIEVNDIKVLFMIRDPRDLLLSHLKYVTTIDKTHPTHNYFSNLDNDTERIKVLLYGEPGIVESIPAVYSKYSGWKDCQSSITIKFEDLIGIKGGAGYQDQIESVGRIVTHLNLDLSHKEIKKIADTIFNKKSDTFRSGKINKWKEYFNESQVDMLKSELGESLIEYGYEKDFNW